MGMVDFQKDFKKMMVFPCLMFCMSPFGKIQARSKERIENWDDLVFSENRKYREYGIQVSLAKDLMTTGMGSHRHLSSEIVGLSFQIVVVAPSTTSPPTKTAEENGTITQRLERFEQLYKDGVITKDEYNAGRAKVLQSI